MRVKMTVDLSGTRDGKPWPPRGQALDLPDAEALQYIEANMAVEAGNAVETATMPQEDVETRPAVTTKTGPARRTAKQ